MSWAALHTRSYYSLLHSASKPIRIAERAVQVGLPAIALTDEGSITGSVAFIKALKNTCQCGHHKNLHGDKVCYGNNKKCQCKASANDKDFPSANIKPILGSEVNIINGNTTTGIVVLAKNYVGWKKLISLTSEANKAENIHRCTKTHY
jgi:DNA polymerase III alpha subunit